MKRVIAATIVLASLSVGFPPDNHAAWKLPYLLLMGGS